MPFDHAQSPAMTPVAPVQPAAAYFGGKRCLAKTMIQHIGSNVAAT